MSAYHRLWSRLLTCLTLSAIFAVACNLGTSPTTPTPIVSPTSSAKPTVSIQFPQNGADAVVGQPITVQATGAHPDGVTRLELRANTQSVDSKISQNPLGDAQFSAYLNYTPNVSGTLVLQVIAYRNNLTSEPAAITINVKAQAAQVTATVARPAGNTAIPVTDPTCRARVEVNSLNFRAGPGQNYASFAVLSLGTVVNVTGRLADRTWWQAKAGNTVGWLSASYITLTGTLCNTTPIVQPPASPTPSATVPPTIAPTVPTATGTLPDLMVVNIQGPTTIILNQSNTGTGTYKVTVQNFGLSTSGQFNVGLVLADGTLKDMGAVLSLAPQQQAVFQTDVTFVAPGSVRLSAFADMNQVIAESSEQNNLSPYDVVLIKPTTAPPTSTTAPATSAATSAATP